MRRIATTQKTQRKKGLIRMKFTKKNVLIVALAVCLLAVISMGTLAWFTDSDEVTNDFYFANSEDDADKIFSVDVWEDATKEDPANEAKLDGIEYPDILPGDDLYKEVNIENTGYYDQYIRATVTVTGASVWQDVFNTVYVPFANLATDVNANFVLDRVVYNADKDTLTYVYYYNAVLESEEVVTLFTNIHISEDMDRFQAAALVDNQFDISVVADAVQTENVGDGAIAAFTTIGKYEANGNYTIMTTANGFANIANAVNSGLSFEGLTISLTGDIDMAGVQVTPIGTKENPFLGTFDGNGYTISNLTMSNIGSDDVALFDYVGEVATLKNVKFANVNISGKYAAVLACDVTGATIDGITVLSGSVEATNYAAGIVAFADKTTITNCENNATITGWSASGIGAWITNATADNCANNGDVTATNRAAGIFANFSGTLFAGVNNGDILCTGTMPAGGIVAVLSGAATLEDCVNTGDVTTTADNVNASAAGILAQTPSAKATIKNCQNSGNIKAEQSIATGIGVSLYGGITATDCTNDGAVTGGDKAEGIVAAKGAFGGSNTATNCVNNGVVTVG